MENNSRDITETELYIMSYYRASELAGALLYGKIALHTEIDKYRVPLTEQSFEESTHAWLWTKAIEKAHRIPIKVTETYQSEYGKRFGIPKGILDILALTKVLEKRTLNHLQKHLTLPDLHPIVKETIEKIVEDEIGHIGWTDKALEEYGNENSKEEVENAIENAEKIDNEVYKELMESKKLKKYFAPIL